MSKTISYFYFHIFYNYLWTKLKKIFIKVIQYIIFENRQMNIDSKNSPTLFFNILHYTTIIYKDIFTGFRLGFFRLRTNLTSPVHHSNTIVLRDSSSVLNWSPIMPRDASLSRTGNTSLSSLDGIEMTFTERFLWPHKLHIRDQSEKVFMGHREAYTSRHRGDQLWAPLNLSLLIWCNARGGLSWSS